MFCIGVCSGFAFMKGGGCIPGWIDVCSAGEKRGPCWSKPIGCWLRGGGMCSLARCCWRGWPAMVGELEETAAQSLWGCSAGPRERVRDNSTGYREEGWRGIACRSDEGRLSDSVQRETPIFLASSQPRGLGMYPPPSPFWAKLPTHAQTCSLALHTVLSPPSSMAMRQVVSYDDITLPTAAASGQPIATPGPPPKKRKVNNTPRNSNARSAQYTQHWD